jgi:hypothetical protein
MAVAHQTGQTDLDRAGTDFSLNSGAVLSVTAARRPAEKRDQTSTFNWSR